VIWMDVLEGGGVSDGLTMFLSCFSLGCYINLGLCYGLSIFYF
jgi:hypothetical protein